MWMQDQKGALALTTLTSQATSSSTLLWFCGLSHHTDHPKFLPFVAWILWLMLAIYSLNIQPPKHLSRHAWYQHFGCSFVGSLCGLRFIPTVGLRALCSFCNYIYRYTFTLEKFRFKQFLERFKWSFLPEWVYPTISGTSEKPLPPTEEKVLLDGAWRNLVLNIIAFLKLSGVFYKILVLGNGWLQNWDKDSCGVRSNNTDCWLSGNFS